AGPSVLLNVSSRASPLLTAALWRRWRVGCVQERRGIRPGRGTMADSEKMVSTVLDRLVPSFQIVERRSTTIAASPDQVWAALSQVTTGELRVFRVLMRVRVLPGRLVRRPPARFDAGGSLLGWAVRFGFSVLGEDVRRELVVGAIGQPWRLLGGRRVAVAGGDEFAALDHAGHAQMGATFRLAPIAAGRATRHSTETRVVCPDPSSARRFGRYWRLIRPASGATRRSWLTAIKRRAERAAGEADPAGPAGCGR